MKGYKFMTRVTFVCLGNICRSPMAEFIFKKMVKEAGMEASFFINSKATSSEEEGNPVYPPAARELARHGVFCAGKRAERLQREDFDRSDYFLCMDLNNLRNMRRIFGREEKQFLLTEFTGKREEIADPWYTGDFAGVYGQIEEGCAAFLDYIRNSSVQSPHE